MKYYDFVDKQPAIGKLVVIEGEERVLADRAFERVIERVLPPASRDLNLERIAASELDEQMSRVRESLQAMPFLASSRLVAITDVQTLKTAPRRVLLEIAQDVPEGNTLLVQDLLSPRSQRPEPFGAMAGRAALRIDTTANEAVRQRFIEELLDDIGAKADPRVVGMMARSTAELASVRNDLEKLALQSKKITFEDLERESLSVADPKAYKYAGALIEGRPAEALAIALEMFSSDRGAAIPLIYALANECGILWELAREGGEVTPRLQWRARSLRPIAAKVGETRARRAYERAVGAFDAIVTGRIEDPQLAVEMLTAELARLAG